MADNTPTTLDAALKSMYEHTTVENLVYKNQPFYGMVPKNERAGGKNIPIVIQYGHTQGRSATFADAQSNATAEKIEDFLLTYKKDYGIATIEGIAAAQAEGQTKTFLDGMRIMVDGAFDSVARSIGISLFRDGTGWRGQISAGSTVASGSITLAHVSQVTNFEVGMSVEASSGLGSGSRNSGAAEVVASVNRSTGALGSTSTNWDDVITAIAASDYLYAEGDFSDGTSSNGLLLSGLTAWVPASAPSSTAWYGVDRSVDTRLGGLRYDGASQLVEEALIDGQSTAAVEGAKIDKIFLNHVKMREMIKAQGSKSYFDRAEGKAMNKDGAVAHIGFSGVVLDGDFGKVEVYSDINCEYNVAWGLEMDTWKLYSIGQAPRLLNDDNNRILRQSSADGYEVRVGGYMNLGCSAPGRNIRIALAS